MLVGACGSHYYSNHYTIYHINQIPWDGIILILLGEKGEVQRRKVTCFVPSASQWSCSDYYSIYPGLDLFLCNCTLPFNAALKSELSSPSLCSGYVGVILALHRWWIHSLPLSWFCLFEDTASLDLEFTLWSRLSSSPEICPPRLPS